MLSQRGASTCPCTGTGIVPCWCASWGRPPEAGRAARWARSVEPGPELACLPRKYWNDLAASQEGVASLCGREPCVLRCPVCLHTDYCFWTCLLYEYSGCDVAAMWPPPCEPALGRTLLLWVPVYLNIVCSRGTLHVCCSVEHIPHSKLLPFRACLARLAGRALLDMPCACAFSVPICVRLTSHGPQLLDIN